MLLPELFATPRHLALVLGYLASIGWEVFVPNLRAAYGKGPTPVLDKLHFNDLAALAGEALDGIGRDAVVLGHGVGGLIALKLSGHRRVKASVAYAPLVPGFRTPLVGRLRKSSRDEVGPSDQAAARPGPVRVDRRFRSLHARWFDQRDGARFGRARDRRNRWRDRVCRADKAAPRLVVAGDSDIFAPLAQTTSLRNRSARSSRRFAGVGIG